MKSERSKAAVTFERKETTISFYLPKDLAVKAWNMAALEKLSFNAYVLKLILEDADELRRLQKERKSKVVKFPGRKPRP